ncbi:MAG: FecR domain-containing protein [Myxococcales bacterium]|nr:FecR domain-containing protein [Myxococcales bacterium]
MKLAEITRTSLHGRVDAETHARGRDRLQAALMRSSRGRRWSRALVLVAAAALAIVAVVVAWPRAPLTFDIEGGTATAPAEGGMWVATEEAASTARFSDGSTVRFAPESSGRFESVRANGARVVLGGGTLHLDITHRKDTSWTVQAGPYVVRVTGTEFDVMWRPSDGAFLVSMQHGSVVVEGPLTPKGLVLSAGQHVQVADGVLRLGEGTAPLLAERSPVPPSEAIAAASEAKVVAPTPIASAGPTASAEPEPSAVPTASAAAERASFSSLVAAGKYADVVKLANGRGLDWVRSSASLEDLSALADAARYAKDGALARAALEAQRTRFGTTQAGRNATFLLGRLAEDSDGNTSRAIALYDEYLQSGGSFAAEALGRKMLAVQRTKGDAGARAIAESYLEKYPKGAFASAARSIVGEP